MEEKYLFKCKVEQHDTITHFVDIAANIWDILNMARLYFQNIGCNYQHNFDICYFMLSVFKAITNTVLMILCTPVCYTFIIQLI